MKRFLGVFGSLVLFLTAMTSVSPAANVVYINAIGGSVDYLNSFGHTVAYLNDPIGLTLGNLSGFDAVMVASNAVFSEPTNIGNVLGDFADSGRGVVLTEFCFQGQWALLGKIMTSSYSPFTVDPSNSGYGITNNSLGTIFDPGNPMLNGVNPANVRTDFQANVGLNAKAILVADWPSGRHAIGYNTLANASVVGLNLFPDSFYTNNADTQRLVANAINFSIQSRSGIIRGHVTDQRNPIAQALVIALQRPTQLKTKTDGNGFYEHLNLAEGTWRVLCWKRGYQFQIKTVTLGPSETKTVDFNLTPKTSGQDDEIPPEFQNAVNAAPSLSSQHKLTTTWGAMKKR